MSAFGAPPGDERRPMSLFGAVGWTLALTLVMHLLLEITEAVRPGALGDLVNVTTCYLLAFLVVLLAALRFHAPSSPMRGALAVRPVSAVHVVLCAIAGAACRPALVRLGDLLDRSAPSPEQDELAEKLLTASSLGGRIALFVALVLVMPTVDELFFRGLLFGALKRGRPASFAIVASSVCFAAVNPNVGSFVVTFLFGFLLAWARQEGGSTLSPLAMHVAFSAVLVVPYVAGREAQVERILGLPWVLGGVAVAGGALGLAHVVARRGETSPRPSP
jgi:membrane protease YdiL (CAAX protease family)